MKIFIKHIIRNIEDNIARTLLMILTLFGVSFILAACIYVLSAAELELKYMNDSQGTYDYMITDIFNDEITLDKLSDLNYNDDLDYYLLNEPKETYYINSKGKEIFINYSTINSTKDNYMELFDLKNDDKLNDGEIIISNTYLILHNLKRDKTIELYNLYGE